MASARKCDRCGKCYDPLEETLEMTRFHNPVFQTSNDICDNVVYKRLVDAGPDSWIDLCPACTAMFKLFMNGVDCVEGNSLDH